MTDIEMEELLSNKDYIRTLILSKKPEVVKFLELYTTPVVIEYLALLQIPEVAAALNMWCNQEDVLDKEFIND
jgi:hypothetical protein